MEMYHPEIEQEDEMVDGPKPPGFHLCEKDESIVATKQSTPRKVRIQRADTQFKFNFKLDYTTDLMHDETSLPVGEMASAPDLHVSTAPADGLAPNGARPSAGAVLNEECARQDDETEQPVGQLDDTRELGEQMDKPGGIIDCVPDEKQDDGPMDCTIDLTEDDTSQPVGKIDSAPEVLHINTVPANVVARNGARPSTGTVLHEEYEKQEDQNEQANRQLDDTLDEKQKEEPGRK